ncbi:riboflavin kinase / FMN adenylyltransferase [Cnuella takakiae]|uniref:Riboflavin biosynthesis protein n=1 Tax=Cnuella takakiae TaxID=1302690 RepID=A0A1M4W085_9BACT|nr:riboflavin biosynthesis protein RibF [Cnuella takakiae]OLY92448.1 riboflavin biosynthesis protein RibF [Cnuella takakiae]SHE74681.1 riboflavin kinase / FMN adenylyltransferase [Cnuella takakiae]
MQVHHSIDALPPFRNAVITIGTFDGVHAGHRQIIAALKAEAAAIDGETVIITFHPHPRKVVYPDVPLQLINTLAEKTALLETQGIDHLVVVPFNEAFAALDAEAYVSQFLIARFQPHTIIIGYDHHFGKGRQGNFKLLEDRAATYGYKLIEIPQHVLDAVEISSTKVRKALLCGDVATANKLLGYPFFFSGLVVHGDKLGRTLGYPTANLQYTDPDKIQLSVGVYAVTAILDGRILKGMLSIGKRPTVNGLDERVEVNLFDFDEEIYGAALTIHVHQYLRGQERYPDLEALKAQLLLDKENSLRVLGGLVG